MSGLVEPVLLHFMQTKEAESDDCNEDELFRRFASEDHLVDFDPFDRKIQQNDDEDDEEEDEEQCDDDSSSSTTNALALQWDTTTGLPVVYEPFWVSHAEKQLSLEDSVLAATFVGEDILEDNKLLHQELDGLAMMLQALREQRGTRTANHEPSKISGIQKLLHLLAKIAPRKQKRKHKGKKRKKQPQTKTVTTSTLSVREKIVLEWVAAAMPPSMNAEMTSACEGEEEDGWPTASSAIDALTGVGDENIHQMQEYTKWGIPVRPTVVNPCVPSCLKHNNNITVQTFQQLNVQSEVRSSVSQESEMFHQHSKRIEALLEVEAVMPPSNAEVDKLLETLQGAYDKVKKPETPPKAEPPPKKEKEPKDTTRHTMIHHLDRYPQKAGGGGSSSTTQKSTSAVTHTATTPHSTSSASHHTPKKKTANSEKAKKGAKQKK